jgi:PIN domain nuclease of toxin-antitoxin system
MDLLIDTHAFLWYITGDKQLSAKSISSINEKSNRCFVSIASIWEIVIKMSTGKLEIIGGFEIIEDFLKNNDFEVLPIDLDDTRTLLQLDFHHRDPFDRIIISQAINGALKIISKDKLFRGYDITVIW